MNALFLLLGDWEEKTKPFGILLFIHKNDFALNTERIF